LMAQNLPISMYALDQKVMCQASCPKSFTECIRSSAIEGSSKTAPYPWEVPMPKCTLGLDLSTQLHAHVTTLIIRNIACRCKFSDALHILDAFGLKEMYDFLYLPMNSAKTANLGYMFVNFIVPEHAAKCVRVLNGQAFGSDLSHKRCEVSATHLQGYCSMVSLFKKKVVLRSKCPPLFIGEGVPITLDCLAHRRLTTEGFVFRA